MIDYSEITDGILAVVEKETPILMSLPEDVITERLNCQNRSIKMLVGHMIDSASNNQQRMVRLQYAPRVGYSLPDGRGDRGLLVFPDYTQDNDLWIHLQNYQHEDWHNLVQLWRSANIHIIQVIKSVDQSKLNNYWLDFEGNQVTLDAMIRGYLDHLTLHVGQIHELLK